MSHETNETRRWRPDDGLTAAVRMRVVPISGLPGPDRAWIVAALTVDGWTVARIAEQLACSPRLVQQIKAEPMTTVAAHALDCERRLREQRGLTHLSDRVHERDLATRNDALARLTAQRDALLDHIAERQRKEHTP